MFRLMILLSLFAISSFNCFASDIYEIDVIFYDKQYPNTSANADFVNEKAALAEQATNKEFKELFMNNSMNAIIVDKFGYDYNVPFKGYIEITDGEISRYRFEGITPSVDMSGEKVFNSPRISYDLYMKELHDGKDLYREIKTNNAPDQTNKAVFRNQDVTKNKFWGYWGNYVTRCNQLKKYNAMLSDESIPMVEDSSFFKYQINSDISLSVLKDESTAFLSSNNDEGEKIITQWSHLKNKIDFLVPEIIIFLPLQKNLWVKFGSGKSPSV